MYFHCYGNLMFPLGKVKICVYCYLTGRYEGWGYDEWLWFGRWVGLGGGSGVSGVGIV